MTAVRAAIVALRLLFCHAPGALAEPSIPPLTGRVVDLADILTNASEGELTDQLAKIETKTGTQIVIAILPGLDHSPIESWGLALGRGWKIGRKGHDDGIIIVLAPKDHEVRIEVGYGLEGRVPDATAHRIIEAYMLPAAREGRFATGLVATITALERAITDPNLSFPPAQSTSSTAIILTMFAALVGFIFFIAVRNLGAWRKDEPYSPRTDESTTSVFDQQQTDRFGSRRVSSERADSFSFRSSSSSGGRSSSAGSFRGGGGSYGGGGASGKW